MRGLLSIDWPGAIFILAATFLLLIGLQQGGTMACTHPLVLSFLIVGAVLFLAFSFAQYFTEMKEGSPIMPLRIFKDPSNLSALAACACDALVFNSTA